jgi:hypothetical protein
MIAWIALWLPLVSTALLVCDKLLRQSRFEVKGDWVVTTARDPMLLVAICNVRHSKQSVRDVRLKQQDVPLGRGWTPYESVLSKLPIVLDVDEESPAFLLRPRSDPPSGLTDAYSQASSPQRRWRTLGVGSRRTRCGFFSTPRRTCKRTLARSRQDDSLSHCKSLVGAPMLNRFARSPLVSRYAAHLESRSFREGLAVQLPPSGMLPKRRLYA